MEFWLLIICAIIILWIYKWDELNSYIGFVGGFIFAWLLICGKDNIDKIKQRIDNFKKGM